MSLEERERTRLRELIVRTYGEYSMVPKVATLLDYDETSNPTRLKFARRVTIEHWMDPSYVHDLVFYDLGRTIGLSEQRYVVEELMKDVARVQVDECTYDLVTAAVRDLSSDGTQPSAILLPIDLYKEVFDSWAAHGLLMKYHPQRLSIEGADVHVFWSNKFNPFNQCFVVRKDFATWVARPSTEVRVEVDFQALHQCEMQVTVESKFEYHILNPQKVKAFEVLSLKPAELT